MRTVLSRCILALVSLMLVVPACRPVPAEDDAAEPVGMEAQEEPEMAEPGDEITMEEGLPDPDATLEPLPSPNREEEEPEVADPEPEGRADGGVPEQAPAHGVEE